MADEPNSVVWDRCVYRVSVLSNCIKLNEAAQHWKTAFKQMETIREKLLVLSVKSGDQWYGKGGKAFQEHVTGLIRTIDKTRTQHERIGAGLEQAAKHLNEAVNSIPIPTWRYAEVQAKQAAFQGTWMNWIPLGLRPPRLYRVPPGGQEAIYKPYRDAAEQAYARLEAAYRQVASLLPDGQEVDPPGVNDAGANVAARTAKAGTGADTTGAGAGGLGAGLPPGGLQTPSTAATTPADPQIPTLPTPQTPDLPGLKDPGSADLPDFPDPTGGLAGLGDLGGGGGGGAGLGTGGALPGSTTSGFGAPGSGVRGLGVPGGGGGTVNAGYGGMPMYPPMMGAPGGQGAGGQGANDCLLQEDEVRVMFGFENGEPDADVPTGCVLDA